jgi:hypothetical protein
MSSEAGDRVQARPTVVARSSLRVVLARNSLESEARHLVGRTRAFLLELEATARELDLSKDPRADSARVAVAAARSLDEPGSLARVERAGTELLRSLDR